MKAFTGGYIRRLNAECSRLVGEGRCPRLCDGLGWCPPVYDAARSRGNQGRDGGNVTRGV